MRTPCLALLFLLLIGGRPVFSQETGVMVTSITVPVETLRLSDFDPIAPEDAPVILTILVTNDERARDLSLEIEVGSANFGFLGRMRLRIGRVLPHEERQVTNRDFDYFNFEEASELIEVASELGRLPADSYTFTVRIIDYLSNPNGEEVARDEAIIEASNPGLALDLVSPGVAFGQGDDLVNNPFPVFEWIGSAQSFDFALYRVRPGQSSPEDVVGSLPVYQREEVTGTTFLYPSSAEELEPGVTYAWQVVARVRAATGVMRFPSPVYAFTMAEGALPRGGEDGVVAPPDPARGDTNPVDGAAARVEVSPQEAELAPGASFLFTVRAFDDRDEPVRTIRPAWRVTPESMGTIDETGLFVAGEQPGPVAVTARVGNLEDFATVLIQETPQAQDPPPVVAGNNPAADTIEVRMITPFEDQEVIQPLPTFAWDVSGVDSLETRQYLVQLWETTDDLPPDAVPDVPPLMRTTVQNVQTLVYPAGVPSPQPGSSYVVRVDLVGATAQVLAQSLPVRFSMASDDKIGWDLRQAWDVAQREQQDAVPVMIMAQLVGPALSNIDRQSLLAAGIQIELEDGPWLQLQVPFAQLSQLSQFDFIRVLNLPAPPLLSGVPALKTLLSPPRPLPLPDDFAGDDNPVRVAIFEFGFDVGALRTIRGGKPFYEHSYRRDGNITGSNSLMAVHGVASVRALLDYLPENAELHLFNFETELEFRDALRYAVETLEVRVVSCSVSWMEAYDNYDGTSYFSQRLDEILGDHATLVTAAGNFGQSHWEGRFTDRQGDGYHDFTPEGGTLQLRLRKDIDYKFLLSWSDDWMDPKIDFDLQVLNAAGTPLYDATGTPYRSSNRQGPQGPQERIRSFRSYLPGTQTYQLRIEARKLTREAGPMPHLELYMYPPPEGSTPGPQPNSSLAGGLATSRSRSVVPVSATGFNHSSEGPTNDNRVRPDFAAGGTVQLQGAQLEGTSFATPRVAAAFALIMTKYPSWTVEQATEYLRSFCPADTDTDKDNQYGWGEIDFESLVQALTS